MRAQPRNLKKRRLIRAPTAKASKPMTARHPRTVTHIIMSGTRETPAPQLAVHAQTLLRKYTLSN
jgi:hypothetical protein